MDRVIQQLLESQVLTDEVKQGLVEAWDQKIAEARQQIEEQTRKEFAKRYSNDKSLMVEAMDKFLAEQVRKEIEEFQTDKKSLKEYKEKVKEFALKKINENTEKTQEERIKLSKAVMEAKKVYNSKINEHLGTLKSFMLETLSKELKEFAIDKKELTNERKELYRQIRESRNNYKSEFTNRVNNLEKFVVKQLSEELKEFSEDKNLLAEERVKFKAESKSKLAEAKADFIKKAAKIVEATAHKSIRSELNQLKTDLETARKNNFGRRIFEAFATEYMASHLSEGSALRNMKTEVSKVQEQLVEAQKVIAQQTKDIESATRKIKLAEDKATRTKVLSDLLQPLAREQKMIMSNLLESVKTERLQESFKRYLPTVLKEVTEGKAKTTLVEEKRQITGDRTNRLSETVNEETNQANGAEIINLKKLAGLE